MQWFVSVDFFKSVFGCHAGFVLQWKCYRSDRPRELPPASVSIRRPHGGNLRQQYARRLPRPDQASHLRASESISAWQECYNQSYLRLLRQDKVVSTRILQMQQFTVPAHYGATLQLH